MERLAGTEEGPGQKLQVGGQSTNGLDGDSL